jgi:hypothetical protein
MDIPDVRTSTMARLEMKDMAEIDQTYKEKIREAEQKGPVYFVAHDAGNDAEAAKSNNLPSLSRYMMCGEVIDRYTEVVLLRQSHQHPRREGGSGCHLL